VERGWASGLGKLRGVGSGKIGLRFKTVNKFRKINKEFLVKRKRFYANYYFTSCQTSINVENIFRKSFYDETNGA
jgi:hypothetical protein